MTVETILKEFDAWADDLIGAYEETPTHTVTRKAHIGGRIEALRSAKINLHRIYQGTPTGEERD